MVNYVCMLTALVAVCAALEPWEDAAVDAMGKYNLPEHLRDCVNAATHLLHDQECYTDRTAPDEATLIMGAMRVVADADQDVVVRAAAAGSNGQVGLVGSMLERGAMGAVSFSDKRAIDLLAEEGAKNYAKALSKVFAGALDAPEKCEGWTVSDEFVTGMMSRIRIVELSELIYSPCAKTYGGQVLLLGRSDVMARILANNAPIEAVHEVLSMPDVDPKRMALIMNAIKDREDIAAVLDAGRSSSSSLAMHDFVDQYEKRLAEQQESERVQRLETQRAQRMQRDRAVQEEIEYERYQSDRFAEYERLGSLAGMRNVELYGMYGRYTHQSNAAALESERAERRAQEEYESFEGKDAQGIKRSRFDH